MRFFQLRQVQEDAQGVVRRGGKCGEYVGGFFVGFFVFAVYFDDAPRGKERQALAFGQYVAPFEAAAGVEALPFFVAVLPRPRPRGVEAFQVEDGFAAGNQGDVGQGMAREVGGHVFGLEVHWLWMVAWKKRSSFSALSRCMACCARSSSARLPRYCSL